MQESNNIIIEDDQSYYGYSRNGSMRSKHQSCLRDDISVSFQDHYADIQKIHQHPEIGLTTSTASEKLVTLIENLLDEKEKSNPFPTLTIIRKELFKITPILYLVGICFLIAAYIIEVTKGIKSAYIIVQAVLMFLFIICHLFMHVREKKLEHNETIAKARGNLARFIKYGDVLQEGVTTTSESISLLSVCRDERWRKVPLNMLVEGDLVSLREGERVDIHLQCIEPDFKDVHLKKGDIYTSDILESKLLQINPNTSKEDSFLMKEKLFNSGRCCFQVSETPMIRQIEMSIEEPNKKRPINPVINAINYIYVVIERFLWISVAVSLLANIFRSIFQHNRNLVDLLIIRQVNLVIAFGFVMLPCILLLITYSIGHAKLLALFDILQERSLKGEISDSHPALNFDTDYSDDKIPNLPFKLMKNYWEAILSSKHVAFSHSCNLLHHVASTTVICCIDKDGIVSEPVNTVNEICFLKDEEPVCLELSAEYTHTQYSISFNDNSWKDHINVLKPLGLDCLLNRTCRIHSISANNSRSNSIHHFPHHLHHSQVYSSDQASKIQLLRDREVSSDTNTQCLCLLAKEIGFSEDVSNQFIKLKEIHTLTQNHEKKLGSTNINNSTVNNSNNNSQQNLNLVDPSPYMISQVAKDIGSETLQLLSKGSTDLVLDHCQLYWDGENLQILDEKTKEKIKQVYHKWVLNEGLTAIAFAYKPIEEKFKKLFTHGSINSPLVDVRFSTTNLYPNTNIFTNSTTTTVIKHPQKIEVPSIQKTHYIDNSNTSPLGTLNTNVSPVLNKKSPIPSNTLSVSGNSTIRNQLLSPKSDIIIVVESPLHGGSNEQTPKPRKKHHHQHPHISSNRNYLKPKSGLKKKKNNKLKDPLGDALKLPPVELEYESDDCSFKIKEKAKEKEVIVNTDEDNEEDSQSTSDESYEADEEDEDSKSVSSEYSNNDSETESEVVYNKDISDMTSESDNKFTNNNNNQNQSRSPSSILKRRNDKTNNSNNVDQSCSKVVKIDEDDIIIDSVDIDQFDEPEIKINQVSSSEFNISSSHSDALEQLQMNQIFIGMVGMKELPKSHANHFVEVLRTAGIRFVYFSDEDRRNSNPFASKLGLETDWNCCISLKELAPHEEHIPDGPSRLPRGISSIRKHLEEVDNVPLLVPMFSDCTSQSKEEMVKILQENGEVVCCIGSALNYNNTNIFCQSDLAFSLEPAVTRCQGLPLSKSDPRPLLTSRNYFDTEEVHNHLPISNHHTKRVPSEYPSTHSLCTDITSLPCSLIFHRRTDFNEILKFFHVGRQLLTNTRQCLLFILSACMSLVLMTLLAGILALSMDDSHVVGEVPLTGLQLMWLEFIIIPLIGFSLLATPEDPNLMKTLSPKNNSSFKHIPTFARYIAIRLVPSILLTSFFFLWSLHSLTGATWSQIFGANLSNVSSIAQEGISYSHALLVSQNIMMFAFVYYLCITSISFIHHTQSILSFNPLKNYIWIILTGLALSLQFAFSFISLKVIGGIHLLSIIPWELYVVLFCWAVIVIILDEFVKSLYKKWFDDLQLELRLEFDTKLGMHSPI